MQSPSTHVVCPHHPACPGCPLIELPPEAAREQKRARVAQACALFPELRSVVVHPCIPAPSLTGYRTRVKCAVDSSVGSRAAIGLYRRNTHKVVDLPQCRVIVPELVPIFDDLRTLICQTQAPIAHLDVRWSRYQKKAHVTFVTNKRAPIAPCERLATLLMQAHPEVAGVGLRRADRGPVLRPLVGKTEPIAGSPFLIEKIGRYLFRLSPGSFFQANPGAAYILQKTVATWCAEYTSAKYLVDLFAGVGLFAIGVALRGRTVTAVESAEQAAADARESATLSHVAVTVHCMPAEKTCSLLSAMHPDIVILDPPRRGAALTLLTAIGTARPSRIVYVACDPETLARDLAVLVVHGYRISQLVPLDMFPLTDHVETAVLLEHVEPVRRIRVRYRDNVMHVSEKRFPFQTPPQEYADYPCLIHSPPSGASGMVIHMKARPKKPVLLEYLALVKGIPHKKGHLPCRKKTHRSGQETYRLLSVIGGYGLVRIYCNSARKLDVLRQFWRIGHPILGDEQFGDRRANHFLTETCGLHRLWLHLHRVFLRRADGTRIRLCMPLPHDLRFVIRRLRTIRIQMDNSEG
ncbi:MAG: 23S rRNA (uracil(1939)-C(5))-methyltransferase RlmD [Desulfobacterota bacterium]|nr:23S rRNA (uracil(1939)-C(5))-methyltransferase RlmD [Thermodesulfobacteriota bacterium]